jgi:hypothetical protein
MSPMRFTPRALLLSLSLALLGASASACKPSAAGGPVDKSARRQAKRAKLGKSGGGKRAGAVAAVTTNLRAASRGPINMADYVPAEGYIVKGTDFLTFWPCGKPDFYFMRPIQIVAVKVAQEYKFASPRPYLAMHAKLRVKYFDDTLTVGTNHFTRYAEVVDFEATPRSGSACPSPTREKLAVSLKPYLGQELTGR